MKYLFSVSIIILIFPLMVSSQTKTKWDKIPADIKSRKYFKRFEWDYKQRAFPNETIPEKKYAKNRRMEIERIEAQRLFKSSLPGWTSIGPSGIQPKSNYSHWGVVSGRVRAIAVHPTDPLTVYIGAACGGIWKSSDGGNTWHDIGQNLESLSYGAIAIDPNYPDTVYAGSGETGFFTSGMHFDGSGLFKSTDGGQSWTQDTVSFGTQTHFADIAVNPHNSNILLAALASGNFYLGTNLPNEGVWKSIDGGQTWTKTLNVNDGYDVLFHPSDSNLVYAGIGGMHDSSGFYISSDQGNTWIQSNSGLHAPELNSRMHIDISQSNPNILYTVIHQVGTLFFNGTSRAYKSTDGGSQWQQISQGVNLGGRYNTGWMDQGGYDLCIAVDPADPDHVFIGNIELHETTDGSNFVPRRQFGSYASYSLVHVDYHKIVFSNSSPNYLYIGCDGGVYLSTDGGNTAGSAGSRNTGLEISQFYRIAAHPTNPDVVIGGMQDNGTALTIDGGTNWNQVYGMDGMECFFDHTDLNIAYASAQMGWLAKRSIAGDPFTFLYDVKGAWITPFFMHPTNNNWLYTANKRVLRSTDSGLSFSELTVADEPALITLMAQSKVNPDIMIFATGIGGSPTGMDSVIIVKISTDGGFNWTDVTNNIPGETKWISRVVTDPLDSNTFYVLRTGLSPGNKVYKSTDFGQNWTNISGNLPDLPCNDLFIDPENNNYFYLANDIGVYMSDDGGSSWVYAGEGMPFVPAIDFDFVEIDTTRYLRIGTHGRSIYETHLSLPPPNRIQEDVNNRKYLLSFNLKQNYPNPFNPTTNIQFSIPNSEFVSLNIYNLLGQEVTTLVSKTLNPGEYKYKWDASDFASGVYCYKLEAGKYIQTQKLILMK